MKFKKLLNTIECPMCCSKEKEVVLKYDRYFLPIDVSVCKTCGLIYSGNNIIDKDINLFYEKYYRKLYNDVQAVSSEFIFKSKDKLFAAMRFKKVLNFLKKENIDLDNILEVGSGTGQFLKNLNEYGCKNYTGIEPGKTFCNYIVQQQGKDHIQNIFFEDIKLDFKPNCIVSFHVLEHLNDPISFLKKSYELLIEKNGYIILEVPGYDEKFEWEKYGIFDFHIGHRIYFTLDSLSNMLKSVGFTLLDYDMDVEEGIILNNLRIYAKVSNQNDEEKIDIDVNNEILRIKNKLKNKWFLFNKSSYWLSFIFNLKAIWNIHK